MTEIKPGAQSSQQWSRSEQTPPSEQDIRKKLLFDFINNFKKDKPLLFVRYEVNKSSSYLIVLHNNDLIYRFHSSEGLYFYSYESNTWFFESKDQKHLSIVLMPSEKFTSLISVKEDHKLLNYYIKDHYWKVHYLYETKSFGLLSLKNPDQNVVNFYQNYLETTAISALHDLFALQHIIPSNQITINKSVISFQGNPLRKETLKELKHYTSYHELSSDINIQFLKDKNRNAKIFIGSCNALKC